jgi:hypothetical protein
MRKRDQAAPEPPSDAPPPDPSPDPSPGAPTGSQKSPTPVDYEARFVEGQRYSTKLAMENADLRRRLEAYEAASAEDGNDRDGEQARPPSRFRPGAESRRSVMQADIVPAVSVHGPEAVEAYSRVANLLDQATTPADRITALEVYREARSAGAPPPRQQAPAPRLPTRAEAVMPRVESDQPEAVMPRVDLNRADAAPDSDQIDLSRYEAGSHGGVGGFVRAVLGARRNPR